MPSADDLKINLNQNLWGLLLSLGALGTSEYYKLAMSLHGKSFATTRTLTVPEPYWKSRQNC